MSEQGLTAGERRMVEVIQLLEAENASLKDQLKAANLRNPLVGIGYLYSAVGITQGDGDGTDEIYQSDIDRQEIARLTDKLNAALEASSIAETGRLRAVEERDKEIDFVERITNVIDGYSWMAEGRGPYRYDDARYDDDVMRCMKDLLECLPGHRSEPYQSFMTRFDVMKAQLAQAQARAELADTIFQDWVAHKPNCSYIETLPLGTAIPARVLRECNCGLKELLASYDALPPLPQPTEEVKG